MIKILRNSFCFINCLINFMIYSSTAKTSWALQPGLHSRTFTFVREPLARFMSGFAEIERISDSNGPKFWSCCSSLWFSNHRFIAIVFWATQELITPQTLISFDWRRVEAKNKTLRLTDGCKKVVKKLYLQIMLFPTGWGPTLSGSFFCGWRHVQRPRETPVRAAGFHSCSIPKNETVATSAVFKLFPGSWRRSPVAAAYGWILLERP